MAYVAPTTRADGYVVDATEWNKNTVDNPIALRVGEIALTSQAIGDVITASSATQLSRVAPGASGTVLTSNGAGVAPSFAVSSYLTLLKANSGTTTSAAAENVDTVAITGLTALDTIQVIVTCESVTQATAGVQLFSSTDAVVLTELSGGVAVGIGTVRQPEARLRIRQGSTTLGLGTSFGSWSGNSWITDGRLFTLTTAWTGAWTLALRQTGVTAGGTFKWSWAVYRLAGQ